jgi:hypothetical protein
MARSRRRLQTTRTLAPHEGYISRNHAAEFLDCSNQKIDDFIKRGVVWHGHVGRKVILRRAELIELLEEGRL